MTITFPRDLPDEFAVSTFSFELQPMAEVTPLRSGAQLAADLGPSLWHATFQSAALEPADLGVVSAWYDTILSEQPFYGYDPQREYPLAYALTKFAGLTVGGDPFGGTARLTAVADNVVEISLDQLPVGFVLSPRDYLAFDYLSATARALHRCSAAAVADGDGALTVEVRPPVRPGWAADATVMLHRASTRMMILPATYTPTFTPPRHTSVTFEAIQTL
jgi:hypothetical protein